VFIVLGTNLQATAAALAIDGNIKCSKDCALPQVTSSEAKAM